MPDWQAVKSWLLNLPIEKTFLAPFASPNYNPLMAPPYPLGEWTKKQIGLQAQLEGMDDRVGPGVRHPVYDYEPRRGDEVRVPYINVAPNMPSSWESPWLPVPQAVRAGTPYELRARSEPLRTILGQEIRVLPEGSVYYESEPSFERMGGKERASPVGGAHFRGLQDRLNRELEGKIIAQLKGMER